MQADKTRVDYLRERKDAIYENLRDLNFEYLAGKYPEQDYAEQRRGWRKRRRVCSRRLTRSKAQAGVRAADARLRVVAAAQLRWTDGGRMSSGAVIGVNCADSRDD